MRDNDVAFILGNNSGVPLLGLNVLGGEPELSLSYDDGVNESTQALLNAGGGGPEVSQFDLGAPDSSAPERQEVLGLYRGLRVETSERGGLAGHFEAAYGKPCRATHKRIVRQPGLRRQGCARKVRFSASNGGIQEGDDDRYGQIRLEQEVLLKSSGRVRLYRCADSCAIPPRSEFSPPRPGSPIAQPIFRFAQTPSAQTCDPRKRAHFPSPTSVRGHLRGHDQGSAINARIGRAPLTRCDRPPGNLSTSSRR